MSALKSEAKHRWWAAVCGILPQEQLHLREGGLSQFHAGAPVSEICLSSSFVLLSKRLWLDIRLRKSMPKHQWFPLSNYQLNAYKHNHMQKWCDLWDSQHKIEAESKLQILFCFSMSTSTAVLGVKSCCLKNVALLWLFFCFFYFVVMLNMQGHSALNTNLHKEEKNNKMNLNMLVSVFYSQIIHYRLQPKPVQWQEIKCGYTGFPFSFLLPWRAKCKCHSFEKSSKSPGPASIYFINFC